MNPQFKKFEIVTVDWGYNMKCLNNQQYTKQQIINYTALNFGAEFSDIDTNCNRNRHMGMIVSSYFFNQYSDTILIAPITSTTAKDSSKHYNKFFLLKKHYHGLKQDSVVILNKIHELDKQRVKRHLFFLKSSHQNALDRRLKKVFAL